MARAVIIAAPASGSGKTVLTLGLLRALKNRGVRTASAKVGPDYIDPRFHHYATGVPSLNLDPWAMGQPLVSSLLHDVSNSADIVVIEGVMGLFDGPELGSGSTADLAAAFDIPVILVIDSSHLAQSIAAIVRGFVSHRPEIRIAGLILNRVASDRHAALLDAALQPLRIPILACIYRDPQLMLPSRHLGLVQAAEIAGLEALIERAAAVLDSAVPTILAKFASELEVTASEPGPDFLTGLGPRTGKIAVAEDVAFSFCYPHLLQAWRKKQIDIATFSPLADEAPAPDADAIYLPGGYPELHAARLSASGRFLEGLRKAATGGRLIYGECGGYMVLGDALIDSDGESHPMAGLLPVRTSFAKRELNLGYRALDGHGRWKAHEFHYSTIDWQGDAQPLFTARDAAGRELGPMGQRQGTVMGSYAHIIA